MTDSQPGLGVELAGVTKGMTSLHRRFHGKGPAKAKTYAGNDKGANEMEVRRFP